MAEMVQKNLLMPEYIDILFQHNNLMGLGILTLSIASGKSLI